MKCYEGSEPYIFLSYAHKNTDMVMPIFEGLYREGFRIWYDTSIEAGSVWMDYIANHVEGSKCFIAFITREYLDSNNCMSELSYAISMSGTVDVLVIFMEDVKLPSGIAMYLSRLQAIYRSKFHSEKDFLEALYNSKLLNACRTVLPDDPYSNIRDMQEVKTFNRLPSNEKELSQNGEQRKVKTQRNEAPQETEPPVRYSEGLTYEKLDDGTYAVTGMGTCKDTEIVIPPITPEGGKVTSIGENAFERCRGLISVVIPTGVTSIGDRAFEVCKDLKSIDIPASVTTIGEWAFWDCCSLRIIDITSVTTISNWVFCGCSHLLSITIPESVTSIGMYAFCGCSDLPSITIPAGVISIADNAFQDCSGLKIISVRPNNPAYYSQNNCVIERNTHRLVVGIQTSQIPHGVTEIGDSAFLGCRMLPFISIPNSVISIGRYAYHNCSGLTNITIPNGVLSIGYYAFWGCNGLKSISVHPNNPIYYSQDHCVIERNTHRLVIGIQTSRIPSDVISIDNGAFSGCSGLESIDIPPRVISIGAYAFNECRGLKSIVIPIGVTLIDDWAFGHCCGLESIVISASVTSVGYGAFEGCENATIYCEHPSQPSTWDENWNPDNCPVVWNYKPENN